MMTCSNPPMSYTSVIISCQANEQCERFTCTHTCASTNICICIRSNIREHSVDCQIFPKLFTQVYWNLMLSAFLFVFNAIFHLSSLFFNELPYDIEIEIHTWHFREWKQSEFRVLFLSWIVCQSQKGAFPLIVSINPVLIKSCVFYGPSVAVLLLRGLFYTRWPSVSSRFAMFLWKAVLSP